jgi:anti-sigma regulatory factor (Ser/Thr protein kinase)
LSVRTFIRQDSEMNSVSELRLPASSSQLTVARRYAEDAAAAFGLNHDECFEFAVAVNEAVTNAIRHGAPDARGEVHLSILESADHITCVVRDCGRFTASVGATASSEHGRGFTLMTALMDAVQLSIASGNTTVRLTKARA